MDFEKVVNERHSVREFSEKEISVEALTKIVKIAQRTPSWTNSQPWKVYVATGEHLKQIKALHIDKINQGASSNTELIQAHRSNWGTQPTINTRNWSTALTNYLMPDIDKMSSAQRELFNAPALVYLTAEKEVSPWMIYDIGAFSQTLMLAAKDNGIDSIPAYEIVRFPEDIHSVMNIPGNEMIIAGIALGYPTNDHINSFYTNREEINNILKIKN
ncbi:nitroreductase [Limosilactobacillus balticus]|uniref:nitroreductase n=1 Tax=Limosilactobacillus balticus TaxID=2759747 RepID=UPI0039921259